MNWLAAMAVLEQIPHNPIIPIDDAYIGICMQAAGFENQIYAQNGFESWGFRPRKWQKFNI